MLNLDLICFVIDLLAFYICSDTWNSICSLAFLPRHPKGTRIIVGHAPSQPERFRTVLTDSFFTFISVPSSRSIEAAAPLQGARCCLVTTESIFVNSLLLNFISLQRNVAYVYFFSFRL